MRNYLLLSFLSTALLSTYNASASSLNFTSPAVVCSPLKMEEPLYGGAQKVKLEFLTDNAYSEGPQKAVLVVSDLDGSTQGLYIGTLNIREMSGNFTHNSKNAKISMAFPIQGKSKLTFSNLEDSKWVNYKTSPTDCSFIQYGSEGVHN